MIDHIKKYIGFVLVIVTFVTAGCDSAKKSPPIEEVKQDAIEMLDSLQVKMWGAGFDMSYQDTIDVIKDGDNFIVTVKDLHIYSENPPIPSILFNEVSFLLSYKEEGQVAIKVQEVQTALNNLSIKKENFDLIWSQKANAFIFANILFKDMVFRELVVFGIEMDSILIDVNYKPADKDFWSGYEKIIFTGMEWVSPKIDFTVKNLELSNNYKAINLVENSKVSKEIFPKVKNLKEQSNLVEDKLQAQMVILKELLSDEKLHKSLFLPWDGSGRITARDILIRAIEGQAVDIKVPEARAVFSSDTLQPDQVQIGFELSNKDATSPITTQLGIDPIAFKFQLDLEKLPLKTMIKELNRVKNNKEVDYKILITKLLANADTVLTLNALDIKVGSSHLTTKGNIKANDKAALGVEGQVEVRVVGIDEVMNKLPVPEEAKAGVEMFKGIVKGFSKMEMENGKETLVYKLMINPDGKIMLNNLSLDELMKALPIGNIKGGHIDDIHTQVQTILDSFRCSRTQAAVKESGDFANIIVTGFVSNNQDKELVHQELTKIKSVNSVSVDSLVVHTWPTCELLVMLGDYTNMANGKSDFPRIRPTEPNFAFYGGYPLDVSLSIPDQSNYVYAGYLQNDDGTIINFIPSGKFNSGGTSNEVNSSHYTVQPPYGLGTLFVISSPEPLFTKPRAKNEPSEQFFDDLLQKLKHMDTASLISVKSDYYVIEPTP